MAEIPRLRQGSSKINSVSEHMKNGVNLKPENLIVDLGSFSNGELYHKISADSRIILQRSFSRKGHLRSDSASLLVAPSSPGGQTGPNIMQEKPTASYQVAPAVVIAVGPTDNSDEPSHHHHHQHQITVKTGSVLPVTSCTSPESQLGRRRSALPWYNHPKRVLLFFATISSIGTLLLICFTLAINKPYSSSD